MDVSVRDIKIEKLYPQLKKIGFDGLDVSFPKWDQREFILSDEFEGAMMQKYQTIHSAGFKVCQTHLTYYPGHLPPLGDGSYEAFEEYMLPILQKEIGIVAKMHCPLAVIHLYFEESIENSRAGNVRLLRALLPLLEEHGVILAIENIFGPKACEAHLSTAEHLLYYTNYFESPYLGVCLDTGHAITRLQNPVTMLKKLGDTVKALHLHASVNGKDMHLPPALVNNVDWREFYELLHSIGYCGPFNMEITAPAQMNLATALAYYTMAFHLAQGLITGDTKSWTEA